MQKFVVAALVAGCSSSGGRVFAAQNAASGSPVEFALPDGGFARFGRIYLSDTPGECGRRTRSALAKGSRTLRFDLEPQFQVQAPTPGFYAVLEPDSVSHANQMVVTLATLDENCQFIGGGAATAGTLELTKASGGSYAGSFDVQFGDERFSGTFDSADCQAVDANPDAGPSTCE